MKMIKIDVDCYNNIDYIGMRFGKLVVIEESDVPLICKNGNKIKQWLCRCDCGNTILVTGTVLKRNRKLSCGCSCDQDFLSHEKLYNVWISMKQRCYNPNDHSYNHYGKNGITVCEEWRNNYKAFREWAYANGYSADNSFNKSTIDRIDVNGNYCPENCRIVSRNVQNDNTTRTIRVTVNGVTHTLKEWSEIVGVKPHTLYTRIYHQHWDPIEAVTTPINTKYRNGKAGVKHGTST